MRYVPRANAINIAFIAALFLVPLAYCLWDTSIPTDIGRTAIVVSFGLSAFAIGDWYHFYYTNSYSGIRLGLVIGSVMATAPTVYVALRSNTSPIDAAMFGPSTIWDGYGYGLRIYLAGVGVVGTAIISIPRLALLKAVSQRPLPVPHDA
jgi:hypothetical protein